MSFDLAPVSIVCQGNGSKVKRRHQYDVSEIPLTKGLGLPQEARIHALNQDISETPHWSPSTFEVRSDSPRHL